MGKNWLARAPKKLTRTNEEARSLEELRDELTRLYVLPPRALLLLDTSGSMSSEDKLGKSIEGSVAFAERAIGDGYQVGIVEFNSDAARVCEPGATLEILRTRASELTARGTTAMHAALRLAGETLGVEGIRAVILATDGLPDDRESALSEAHKLKGTGVQIITIGTPDADEAFLKLLATASDLSVVVANADLGKQIAASAKLLAPPGSKPSS